MTNWVKIDNDLNVKLSQNLGDGFKVKVASNGRFLLLTGCAALIALALITVSEGIAKSNDLRRQELEVAKKQYQLDSLRYYAPLSNQQVKKK